MRCAVITRIEYALPTGVCTNRDLTESACPWSEDEIHAKTGIVQRHVAASDETAADLAYRAADRLLGSVDSASDSIDLLVFCTQTPDFALPTTACLLQDRLKLPTTCAAFDFNLGCSGYVYGLAIVKSMIETGEATKALLLTGETYTKWIHPDDFSTRVIFGDAGTATLVETTESEHAPIGPFVYGTDGRGKDNLIVPSSGARQDTLGKQRPESLFMDGPEIFSFTMRAVPTAVRSLLAKAELGWGTVDWAVFHQANRFMLEHLRKQCRIPAEKFVYCLENYGNTVSNTIPITLADMVNDGRLHTGDRAMLVGFGVGYSWSACMVQWH